MKKIIIITTSIYLAIVGLCLISILQHPESVSATTLNINSQTKITVANYAVATLPTAASGAGTLGYVTDGSSTSDCTTGGGTNKVLCIYTGATWIAIGVGAGGASSVFTGSTASTITCVANITFPLADVAVKSPVRFETTSCGSNVTSVTFTSLSAGARFQIAWLLSGSSITVNYGASASRTCTVSGSAGSTFTQDFIVAADGTTVLGLGCGSTDPGLFIPNASAPTANLANNSVLATISNVLNWNNNNTGFLPGTQTVASGTSALGTAPIASAGFTLITTAATGVATTDVILAGFNGDPTAATGYMPSTSGMLTIVAYPTSGNVNFKVINNTTGSITPGAITLNWRVVR